jgi:hypothetical protein
VSLANVYLFADVEAMSEADKVATYILIYEMALAIPVISVLGVALAGFIKRRDLRRLMAKGLDQADAKQRLERPVQITTPNWWILGGSLVFAVFTVGMGLSNLPYNQEIIFVGSMAIVIFLMSRLMQALDSEARLYLLGTAIIIFVFRAMPGPGAGQTWWMIDELAFDQQFLSVLALIGSTLALAGTLHLPALHGRALHGLYSGLPDPAHQHLLPAYRRHVLRAAQLDGRSHRGHCRCPIHRHRRHGYRIPLGQIAMVPMLAWIANSAPDHLKATFFAVMASFSNLALSAGQLGTKYLNEVFLVTREVRDPLTGVVTVPADYGQLGDLMIAALLIGLILPLAAVLFVKVSRLRSV